MWSSVISKQSRPESSVLKSVLDGTDVRVWMFFASLNMHANSNLPTASSNLGPEAARRGIHTGFVGNLDYSKVCIMMYTATSWEHQMARELSPEKSEASRTLFVSASVAL